jgi:ionotropic glutamate receptor
MQESGELTRLKTKWWNEKRGGGACDGQAAEGAPKLTFNHVKGIFLVLFFGCWVGSLLGLFRWLMNVRKMSKFLEIPFMDILKEEIKFTFQFSKNVKPSYLARGSTQDDNATNDSPRESNASGSGSRSSSTNEERQPRTLRLSSKNIHKIDREII